MANSLTVWSSTNDGSVTSTDTDYTKARNGTGVSLSADTTATSLWFCSRLSAGNYVIAELFFDFDTSSVGSGSTVTTATLSLYGNGRESTTIDLEARPYDWGAGVTTGDWRTGDQYAALTKLCHFSVSGTNWSITGYNAFTDDAFPANVNKTGTTYVVIGDSKFAAGTANTGDDSQSCYLANDSTAPGGTGRDPKLYVEYESPGVRIVVPVELADAAMISTASSDTSFTRCGVWLDPADFDGTCTYYFEINILASSASGNMDVCLYNDDHGIQATATGTTGMTSTTRVRSSSFVPQTGAHYYYVLVRGSQISSGTYTVYSARLIIKQVDATKTSIPIPLMQYAYSTTLTTTGTLGAITSTSYGELGTAGYHSWWARDDADWATISGYRLEAIGYTSNGSCSIDACLYNRTDDSNVTNSAASSTSTSPAAFYTDFTSDTNFHDGDTYSLRFKSQTGSTVYVQGGRFWVKLTNITKGEVYFRILMSRSSSSTWTASTGRACLELNSYSNPTLYHEADTYTNHTSDETVLSWQDCDTSDSASGTENSQFRVVSPANSVRAIARGSAITALVNNDRINHTKLASTGTVYNQRSFAVIAFSFTPTAGETFSGMRVTKHLGT